MSAAAQPITAATFALAIQDLPIENIYAKAHEIENSIAHLRRSNATLQEYSDSIRNDSSLQVEGDKECLEAIRENEVVIERQRERVDLLQKEVERRGGRWHGGGEAGGGSNGEVNGGATMTAAGVGRLTDEELQRRMAERMADDDNDDGDDGMHL